MDNCNNIFILRNNSLFLPQYFYYTHFRQQQRKITEIIYQLMFSKNKYFHFLLLGRIFVLIVHAANTNPTEQFQNGPYYLKSDNGGYLGTFIPTSRNLVNYPSAYVTTGNLTQDTIWQLEIINGNQITLQGSNSLYLGFCGNCWMGNRYIYSMWAKDSPANGNDYFTVQLQSNGKWTLKTARNSYLSYCSNNCVPIIPQNNLVFSYGTNPTNPNAQWTLIPILNQTNSALLSSNLQALSAFISMPSIRIICGNLVNLFGNYDKLQLYYYHNIDYGKNYQQMLTSVYNFLGLKGSTIQSAVNSIDNKAVTEEASYFNSLDYKLNYSSKQILNKNTNGAGFIINNYQLIVYVLPASIAMQIVFFIIFKLSFKYPFSIFFRKFSFFGILIIMLCQGNIEQFTFYMFAEFSSFFSASFHHKCINIVLVLFFLIVMFAGVISYIFFRCLYKNKVKYFLENGTNKMGGILVQTVDRGLICLILGAVHFVMITSPFYQMIVLLSIEAAWFVFRCCSFASKWYSKVLLIWINVCNSLMRMAFILTSIFNADALNSTTFLYRNIQFEILVLMMGVFSTLEIVVVLVYTVIEVGSMIKFCLKFKSNGNKIKKIHQLKVPQIHNLHKQNQPKIIKKIDYIKVVYFKENNVEAKSKLKKVYRIVKK